MLHLHDLLWFHTNLWLSHLLDNIKKKKERRNEKYRKQVLAFINNIFSENISDSSLVNQTNHKKSQNLYMSNSLIQESVKHCVNELQKDSDFVIIKTQKHVYDMICVKYEDVKK